MKLITGLIGSVFIGYILTSVVLTQLAQREIDNVYRCVQKVAASTDRKLLEHRDIGRFIQLNDAGAQSIFFWGDNHHKSMQTTTGVYELMTQELEIPKNAMLTLNRYKYTHVDSCLYDYMAQYDIPIKDDTNQASFICYKQDNEENCLMSSSK